MIDEIAAPRMSSSRLPQVLVEATAIAALCIALTRCTEDQPPAVAHRAQTTLTQAHATVDPDGNRRVRDRTPDKRAWTRIEVQSQGSATILERTPQGPWRVTSPVSAKADAIAVEELVRTLDTIKLTTVVDAHPDAHSLKRHGLDVPQWMVSATSATDDVQTKTRFVGGYENDYDGRSYVQTTGAATIYSVEGSVRRAFAKSTDELRDKSLLPLEFKTLTRIEFVGRHNRWSAQKTASTWKFDKPFVEAASSAQLESWVASLKGIRCLSFLIQPQINKAALGLEPPEFDVAIRASGDEAVRIQIGRPVDDRRYAMRTQGADMSLAVVASEAGQQLDKPAADLIDKTVIQFDRAMVTRIEMRRGPALVVAVQKQPESTNLADGWRVVAPYMQSLQLMQATGILWNLGAMKAGAIVVPTPRNLTTFGVTETSTQIAIFSSDGAPLAKLIIGSEISEKPGYVYVATGDGRLAEVHRARVDSIVKSLNEFATLSNVDGGPGFSVPK